MWLGVVVAATPCFVGVLVSSLSFDSGVHGRCVGIVVQSRFFHCYRFHVQFDNGFFLLARVPTIV